MRPILRGAAALLTAPALTFSALVAASAPASAATDPAPATTASTWLESQLTDGLVLSPYEDEQGHPYPDYGLTIDVGLAEAAAGAPASVVGGISDALAAQIDKYVAPGFGTRLSPGSAAKAAVLADAAGDDPTTYGGRDLVDDVESRVATTGAIAGRVQDDWDSTDPFAVDYANVLSQAYAAQALDAAGSADTEAVTDFLLEQQCSDGYFRQDFSAAAAPDQTCDGSGGKPNVDVTALAIEALQSQLDDADVAASVDDAVAWLAGQQKGNGGFGSDADISEANANSTGAAAYALLLSGRTESAAKGAAWLRAHQLGNVANCAYYDGADLGAVTYDDADRTAAQSGAMDAQARYKAVRATAQAVLGLLAAPTGAGSPNVLLAPGYVKAGATTQVGVNEAAPGEALCATLGEQSVLGWADPAGDAALTVRVPAQAGRSTVAVANAGGEIGAAELVALGAKKLPVTVKKKRVAEGQKQVITVHGLAPGEEVTAAVHWTKGKGSTAGSSAGGQATGAGVFRFTVKVPHRPGAAEVKAYGQFKKVRRGSASFVVTR